MESFISTAHDYLSSAIDSGFVTSTLCHFIIGTPSFIIGYAIMWPSGTFDSQKMRPWSSTLEVELRWLELEIKPSAQFA
jgi:hypothetical protein